MNFVVSLPQHQTNVFLVSNLIVKNIPQVNKTIMMVSSYSKINEIELFSDRIVPSDPQEIHSKTSH